MNLLLTNTMIYLWVCNVRNARSNRKSPLLSLCCVVEKFPRRIVPKVLARCRLSNVRAPFRVRRKNILSLFRRTVSDVRIMRMVWSS